MEQRLSLVEKKVGKTADGHILNLYKCQCGREVQVRGTRVRKNRTRSCGCLKDENRKTASQTHGMRYSREYKSWSSMITRCTNPKAKGFKYYGGRGITVCKEWSISFEAFFLHLGPRPKETSLDRIDGTKGYEPENVRWATRSEQARNRQCVVIVDTPLGTMPLVDYAKAIGITKGSAHLRLKRGKLTGVSVHG